MVSTPKPAYGCIAAADINDTTATGPVPNWRDEPNKAAIITGKKEAYKPI